MKSPVFSKTQKRAGQTDASFLTWFVDSFLPKHFPEAMVVDRPMLLAMHETGLRYARHFGFEDRADQTQFLALMNDVGPDFWRFDGFREAIGAKDKSPDERISLVYDTVTGAQFETALMEQEPLYWFAHQVSDHALGMS